MGTKIVTVDVVGDELHRGDYVVYYGSRKLQFARYICQDEDWISKSVVYKFMRLSDCEPTAVLLYIPHFLKIDRCQVPEILLHTEEKHRKFREWFS